MDYRYLGTRGALNEAGTTIGRAGRSGSWRGSPVAPEVLGLVPASLARENTVFPVAADGETLVVAAADPGDIALADKLAFVTARKVKLIPGDRPEIEAAIDVCVR
jgi:Type II secretion system (T2SS), protein E, N-terminal domain